MNKFFILLISIAAVNFCEAATIEVRALKANDVDGSRLLTNIGGQFFYQSTGTSSGAVNTVFPFNGFREKDGWLIKPGSFYDGKTMIGDNFIAHAKQLSAQHAAMLTIRLNDAARETALSHYCTEQPQIPCWQVVELHDYVGRELAGHLFNLEDARISYKFHTGIWQVASHDNFLITGLSEYFKYDEQLASSSYSFKAPEREYNLEDPSIIPQLNNDLKNLQQ